MSIHFTFVLSFVGFTAAISVRLLIALIALAQGASPATVGALASVLALCPLALSLLVGHMADRHGSRWLLLAGAVLTASGLLIPVFVIGVDALYVTALLAGMGLAFNTVVLQNLVGIQSRPEERTRNFSNYSLVTACCLLAAPLLTGGLVDFAGPTAACLYVVSLSGISMVMLLVWGGGLPAGSGKPRAGAGMPAASASSGMWRALAVSSCVQLSIDLFQFCVPIYGHGIGLSASVIGVVLGAYAAAAFVVRVAMPRLIARMGEQRLLAASFWLGAAAFLLLPLSQSAAVLAAIAFLFGIAMGCSTPLSILMMFSHSPAGRSGRALGLRLTVNNTLRVVGPAVFGGIGAAFGMWPIFVISAAVMAAGGLISRPGVSLKDL
ncbi:MAG: MFS transporter [Betaproteobacteria bacterium]|nr:MFS transporter [Betaproteobacteria bacterium]